MSVHGDHYTIRCCNNISSSRFTLEESSFSEEITLFVVHDFLWRFPGLYSLGCDCSSFLQKEQIVTGLAFFYYHLIFAKLMLNESISKFRSFIRLHSLKNGNRCKERLVLLSASLRSIFHNMVESISVEFPKHTGFISCNCCCSWSVIK